MSWKGSTLDARLPLAKPDWQDRCKTEQDDFFNVSGSLHAESLETNTEAMYSLKPDPDANDARLDPSLSLLPAHDDTLSKTAKGWQQQPLASSSGPSPRIHHLGFLLHYHPKFWTEPDGPMQLWLMKHNLNPYELDVDRVYRLLLEHCVGQPSNGRFLSQSARYCSCVGNTNEIRGQ
jgi:hypothetical protein